MAENQHEEKWQDLVTDVDAFWNEETCQQVRGKLVSITNMVLDSRETDVAVILLTEPCKGVKGKGDAKEEVTLEPGEAIGVVIKHKLRDLWSMLDNQCEVDIVAKEKIKLTGSRTMWRYGIRWRGRRTTTAGSGSGSASGARSSSPDPEKSAEEAISRI